MASLEKDKEIRVRMAPSPTGPLHIGTAWMTLFDFLFARHEGGTFILRIEDTDPARSKTEHEIGLIEGLHWLGLDLDEGPTFENGILGSKGSYGPYRDSERVDAHKKYITRFLTEGKAYQCYCTKEELDAQRKASEAKGVPFRYPGTCRNLTAPPAGKSPQVIRLKMPQETISFDDIVRGEVSFRPEDLDDFAIARSDGSPLYNFSVVINDYEMKITHVVRGEDHISNTPKQIAVFMALGVPPPQYAHVPLILNPDRSKMSKRFGDTTVAEYRARGYLPEALINFLVLLGWHPQDDQEIFSLDELIEKFELSRVRKSGAIFDQAKLDWLNREYLKKLSDEEIAKMLKPFWNSGIGDRGSGIADEERDIRLANSDSQYPIGDTRLAIPDEKTLLKFISLERGRANTLRDFIEGAKTFFTSPDYDVSLLVWKKAPAPLPQIAEILTELRSALMKASEEFTREELLNIVNATVGNRQKGEVFWPLRIAVSGQEKSPDPTEIMAVLGKEESIKRIGIAIKKLED